MARAISFGTTRFRPLAATVKQTIATTNPRYGLSSPVSFGPAGRPGLAPGGPVGFASATEALVSHNAQSWHRGRPQRRHPRHRAVLQRRFSARDLLADR